MGCTTFDACLFFVITAHVLWEAVSIISATRSYIWNIINESDGGFTLWDMLVLNQPTQTTRSACSSCGLPIYSCWGDQEEKKVHLCRLHDAYKSKKKRQILCGVHVRCASDLWEPLHNRWSPYTGPYRSDEWEEDTHDDTISRTINASKRKFADEEFFPCGEHKR